jgi:hypothetical protein
MDPDLMGSPDPYPDPGGKHRKKLINFIFSSAGCFLLRVEGFSCSLDISEQQFLIKKEENPVMGLRHWLADALTSRLDLIHNGTRSHLLGGELL